MLESLIAITLGIISILGSLAFVISHLIKHYFAELKPNGGSSLKDQVNRLEEQHNRLDSKVDKIYEILLSQTKPTRVVKTKK
jgi:hypothetical protein